jgi:hypothetical protein
VLLCFFLFTPLVHVFASNGLRRAAKRADILVHFSRHNCDWLIESYKVIGVPDNGVCETTALLDANITHQSTVLIL